MFAQMDVSSIIFVWGVKRLEEEEEDWLNSPRMFMSLRERSSDEHWVRTVLVCVNLPLATPCSTCCGVLESDRIFRTLELMLRFLFHLHFLHLQDPGQFLCGGGGGGVMEGPFHVQEGHR